MKKPKPQSDADRFCELAEEIVNATPPPKLANYDIPSLIIAVMKENWPNYGGFDGPFTVASAIECAVNDLIDHARDLGLDVCYQGEEIGVMGITVREDAT